ncbi:Lipid-A-disaccharide synthase [alpha proteobacterium BAL199]|jgi:lipid-A-disaccharide synthase|nr:Lipid-A-disaccharide synthase [alpha proteobacterium BAL199]
MTKDGEPPLIYLMAGEASGDVLGAGLMRSLRAATGGHVRFAGLGGDAMTAEGLASLFPISQMAVMGIVEILPKAPMLLRRVRQTADDAWDQQPSAVVSIDSKAFTMRVQKRLFQRREKAGGVGPKLIHWVPPTVWAWRPGRAAVIAQHLDHLMTLFPFEPPYFEQHGLETTFVGHPAARQPTGNGAAFRGRFRLPKKAPVLGVMPGSRPGEVKRLMPVFREVVTRLAGRYPSMQVVIPTVPLVADAIRDETRDWRAPVTVVQDAKYKYDAFAACTAALAASGTVTLELTIAGVPTVVAYRVNALSAAIARRLIDPEAIVLTNKLMGRRVVPQFIQDDCTADRLTVAVERLFDDPRARAEQAAASEATRSMLLADGEDPSDRAARTVLDVAGIGRDVTGALS